MCDSIYRDLTCAVTNENGVVEDEDLCVVEDEDLGVVEDEAVGVVEDEYLCVVEDEDLGVVEDEAFGVVEDACQIFVLPSTEFEPTPLIHCSTNSLSLTSSALDHSTNIYSLKKELQ